MVGTHASHFEDPDLFVVSDNPEDRPERWSCGPSPPSSSTPLARNDLLVLADQWDEMAEREEIRQGIKRINSG